MAGFPPVDEQLSILRRGVEKIVPEDELARKLEARAKELEEMQNQKNFDLSPISRMKVFKTRGKVNSRAPSYFYEIKNFAKETPPSMSRSLL